MLKITLIKYKRLIDKFDIFPFNSKSGLFKLLYKKMVSINNIIIHHKLNV